MRIIIVSLVALVLAGCSSAETCPGGYVVFGTTCEAYASGAQAPQTPEQAKQPATYEEWLEQQRQFYAQPGLYPDYRMVAAFPVARSVQEKTGLLIRSELFKLYLLGIGSSLDSGKYFPNVPNAIASATDTAAREALIKIQELERANKNRHTTLAILKKGNLLRGEQLVMIGNLVAYRCRPNQGALNSFGEATWTCQENFKIR